MAKALTDQDWLDFYQKQYDQAQKGYFSGDRKAGDYIPAMNAAQAKIAALNAKLNPSDTGTTDPIADAKIRVTQDTEGRGKATMEDPYLKAALERLDTVSSGKDAPFTQQVQDQMLAKRAGATSAAEGAQSQQLRESLAANGGNVNDPSFRAAQRQMRAQSQSQNLNDLGNIQTQSQLSNFGARQDATRALQGARMGQLGEANRNYNQGAAYYARTQQAGDHVNAIQSQQIPLLPGIGGAYGGGGFQYQPPAQTAAHAPAPGGDHTFDFQPMDDSGWATGAGDTGHTEPQQVMFNNYDATWQMPQQTPRGGNPRQRQLDPSYTFGG